MQKSLYRNFLKWSFIICSGAFILFSFFVAMGFLREFDKIFSSLFLSKNFIPFEIVYYFSKLSSSVVTSGIFVVLMILFLYKRKYWHMIFILYFSFFLVVLTLLVKYGMKIERPIKTAYALSGYSYPSGHGVMAIIVALALFYLSDRESRLYRAVLIGGLVSFVVLSLLARIALNVHWFSDIIGTLLLALSVYFFTKLRLDERA